MPFVPLVVGIHGGTCKATSFDLEKNHTASLACDALCVPFVAFNRLNYADSATFERPEGSTYRQEEGRQTHELILPAIWEEFGKPNGCTGMVLLAHSMGVPCSVYAAAMHAQEAAPKYSLAGLILTGYGTRLSEYMNRSPPPDPNFPEKFVMPMDMKRKVMLSDEELDCGDPVVFHSLEEEHTYVLRIEVVEVGTWGTYWRRYSDEVKVPVQIALGEHDFLWAGTKEHLDEFMAAFPKSERVDGSIVRGAPHSLESWRGSAAWYYRSFAWAAEVCTTMALKKKDAK